MKCKSCMWFVAKKSFDLLSDKKIINIGTCQKHAPTLNGYPIVFVNDWCGDHKLNENWVDENII